MALVVTLAVIAAGALFAAVRATRRLASANERGDRLAFELRRVSADAESAVEASRDRFEDLARVAPVGFIEADGNGDVTYVSERAAELLACERTAARGMGWLEAVHPDDRERVRQAWRQALVERRRFAAPFLRAADDDGPRWLLAQAVPLVEPTGAVARVVGTVADVTEQRRLEDRVRETQRMESLALLAGGVAHDFNNLLLGVIGQVDLLKARLPEESPHRALVEQIEVAALRGSDLAKKMLSYSGRGVVAVEPVDVRELADEMRRLLEVRVPGIRSEHQEAPLPPIEADPVQIRQVLLNLIVNASEASGEPRGPVIVRTGTRTWPPAPSESRIDVVAPPLSGEFVVLEVEDQGAGMDRATASAVFDPFFTTKTSGRGLGLAVVLGVVRRHGGGLTMVTAPGEGTVLTAWLPPVPPVKAEVGEIEAGESG